MKAARVLASGNEFEIFFLIVETIIVRVVNLQPWRYPVFSVLIHNHAMHILLESWIVRTVADGVVSAAALCRAPIPVIH